MTALRPPGPRGARTSWHLAVNAGVVVWLAALLPVTLLHRLVPASGWLMVHLLLLGAVTNAVLVWSAHFADALLKHAAPGGRRGQVCRLAALNVGVASVVGGVVGGAWWWALAGAVLVGGAAAAHGTVLARQAHAALPSRFGGSVRYYVAASMALPLGAGVGTLLARGPAGPWHGRLVMAHLALNLLGWVGLTVLGTLLTLWPTILRTRIAEGAETVARQALPVLVGSVALTVAGSLGGLLSLTAVGILAYLAGLLRALQPMLGAARNRPPSTYAGWSVMAAMVWLAVSLVQLAVLLLTSPTWQALGDGVDGVATPLAAGFAAQVLLGALSYLVPVVLGGGPSRVRAATAALERGGILRVVVINLGLALFLLPVPSLVRVLVSILVLAAFASFLVLLAGAVRVSRSNVSPDAAPGSPARHVPEPASVVRARHTGMAATGLAAVVLAVAGGAALDPAALGTATAAAAAGVRATGQVTTVRVEAHGMRFHPASVDVPAGNRLVVVVTNRDRDVHDLALETGQDTGRLAPGGTGRIEVAAVGRDLSGWCTVVGHRQMGMLFSVKAIRGAMGTSGPQGAGTAAPASHPGHEGASGGAAPAIDFLAAPPAGFTARDARLPAAPTGPTTHRVTLTAREVERDVAVGVRQRLWTFNGTAPGPVLRGRVGDVFEVTLVNRAAMGHSVDFHAGSLAPDGPMRTVAPGGSLTFRFTATKAGIWMYHCSSMPMSLHIANGMFGAVVIDPPDLSPVAREYVLVQSELYLGPQGGTADPAKIAVEKPDAVVFNGFANQYDHDPLPAKAGERVRIWVLDAGPNRGTSFHVVGGQLDTVFSEGGYLLRPGSPGGAQSLALAPAQGGFVELVPPEPGHYPFVSHVMVDAERGAHGVLQVSR